MNRLIALTIGISLVMTAVSINVYGDSGRDYWATWRGPDATGTAPNADVPMTWSESENIKWKVKLPGQGLSSPVIWGNRIFFQTAIKTDKKETATDSKEQTQGENQNTKRPFHGGKRVRLHN